MIFGKSCQMTADTLRVKRFVKIAPSRTISEVNMFLCFTQKFKMAAENGGQMMQMTMRALCGPKILLKLLYLVLFLTY